MLIVSPAPATVPHSAHGGHCSQSRDGAAASNISTQNTGSHVIKVSVEVKPWLGLMTMMSLVFLLVLSMQKDLIHTDNKADSDTQ